MYAFRPVTPGDLDLVCRHRHEMFKASGRSDEVLAPMTAAFRPWLEPRLASGAYFGWIALADDAPVAGLGMMVIDWPPHPSHPEQGERGYVLNVFVEPGHRGRGLAKALMELATDEARHRGIAYMVLHATQMGRPLYEGLGWRASSEMTLSL
ncbi:MAG: GNAT family N-acetyltransferase [Phenylobacterium sp.]|uniref:GNAT family N-acetyltransferase n=1 Tax=Phenylobacterium sp. TaxID=1871053 RepID=UPI00391D2C27